MDQMTVSGARPEKDMTRRLRIGAGILSIIIGGKVLFGWMDDITALTQINHNMAATNPLSAIMFIIAGLALTYINGPRKIAFTAGGIIAGVGIIKLVQAMLGVSFEIDQILFTEKLGKTPGVPNNHMSIDTAICLVMIGAAFITSRLPTKNNIFISQGLSIITMVISLIAILGFVLGILSPDEIKAFNDMGVHTAIALMVVCVGIISTNPKIGVMRIISDRGSPGKFARVVLPLAVLMPVGVGMLQMELIKNQGYSLGNGIALQVFTNLMAALLMLMGAIIMFYRSDMELRSRESKKSQSEEEYKMAERMGQVGHWRMDMSTDALTCSEELFSICGMPVWKKPTAENLLELLPKEDAEEQNRMTRRAIMTGETWDLKLRLNHPDGTLRYIRSHGESNIKHSDNGKTTTLFGVIADVTELEEARRGAEDAKNAKASFLANMSHEVRTPLNAIIGFTDLILDSSDLKPQIRHRLTLVKTSGDALLTVVNDILDFSKMDAGKMELVKEPFELRSFLENSVSIVTNLAEIKGLDIQLQVESSLEKNFIGDRGRLRQVLLNLLSNGIKFTSQGHVILEVSQSTTDPAKVRFTVSDTGSGIAKDKEHRLFQQFSQTDATVSREHGGTGLGLAICKRLTTLMNGEIGYRPSIYGGSEFWFEIDLEPTTIQAVKVETATTKTSTSLSILVAEDLAANQDLAIAILERMGHRVKIASNGKEALSELQNNDYDLVLMDIQMPVMDGITATKLIRMLPGKIKDIPIIALSASVLREQVEIFREAGMNDHIGKPIKIAELNAVIALNTKGLGSKPKAKPEEPETAPPTAQTFDKSIYDEIKSLLGADQITEHLGSFQESMSSLERDEMEAEELGSLAHAVAGRSGMFGFTALSGLCVGLEDEIRGNKPYGDQLAKVHNAITSAKAIASRLLVEISG